MSILYIDAIAGLSGDMTVGAFLNLGLSIDRVREELGKIDLTGYSVAAEPRHINGILATKFVVEVQAHGHPHRAFRDIRAMLGRSGLDAVVKDRAVAIFTALARAEGTVHGVNPDDVEFHEVGAIDSIVDIVAAAVGFDVFRIERVHVSPLPAGTGVVRSAHGPLPVPAPATVELLKGFPLRIGDGEGELVTPTGAAVLAALATPAPAPEMAIEAVGYGAGQRTLRDRPNVVRFLVGECAAATTRDSVVVVETNIDDYNPEFYEHVVERLFAVGARDVYLAPVHMKKNRPGIVLSVLCDPADRDRVARTIVSETSAIGVRFWTAQRLVLARETREVATSYGVVRVKIALSPDGHENVAPEYEDCRRLARERNVPIKIVAQAALVAALRGPQ